MSRFLARLSPKSAPWGIPNGPWRAPSCDRRAARCTLGVPRGHQGRKHVTSSVNVRRPVVVSPCFSTARAAFRRDPQHVYKIVEDERQTQHVQKTTAKGRQARKRYKTLVKINVYKKATNEEEYDRKMRMCICKPLQRAKPLFFRSENAICWKRKKGSQQHTRKPQNMTTR